MPVKVSTLLLSLAKKVGYDPTLLAFPSEVFEIPDDLSSALETKLFDEAAAKNNPTLKFHFTRQALDGVDKNLSQLMTDFELDEDVTAEINGIKSTYERVPALIKKIKELESQKAGAAKGDKAALQEQINLLNSEKAKLLKEKDDDIKKIQKEYESQFTDNLIKNKIAAANLVTDNFPKEVMMDLAYKYLHTEFKAQDAKAIQKDGVLKLVKASDDALDYYADNKAVGFDEFLDSVLSKNKLIQVNKQPPASPSGPQNQAPKQGEQQRPANTSFASMLANARADLERSQS